MSDDALTLERCREAVDSESADAPCDPDVWELRRRISWLSARLSAEREQGIYRVSLDAAIEAAAEQDCEDWENCTVREVHRGWARKALTAAVMGGAQ